MLFQVRDQCGAMGGTLGGLVMGWTWKALAPAHTFGLAAAAAAAGAICAAMSFRSGPAAPGTAQDSSVATRSAMASDEVSPGDSMPNR